jgi:hypothetical protein
MTRLGPPGNPLADTALDVATFGTPIRYGWELEAVANLVHFVNHRPRPDRPEHHGAFPPTMDDVLYARGGDLIQQLGIAGTDFAPTIFVWRTRLAHRRLRRLLERGLRPRALLDRLETGARVAEDGTTLLVDYGEPEGHPGLHFAGHAVYTLPDWMAFHTEEIARRFYA